MLVFLLVRPTSFGCIPAIVIYSTVYYTVGSSQCLWNQPLMRMDHSMDMAETSMFRDTAERPYLAQYM